MKRRNFIKVAGLAAVSAAAFSFRFQSNLDTWAQRFGARIERSDSGLRLQLAVDPDQFYQSLDALDRIADGPIQCKDNQAHGQIAGETFVARFGSA